MLTPELEQRAKDLSAQYPNDIVAVYDTATETCLWASTSHYYVLGYSQDEMLGRPWTDFVAPEDHSHASLAGTDALLNGRSIEVGMRTVTKEGERVSVRGSAWIAFDLKTRRGYLFFQARQRPSRR